MHQVEEHFDRGLLQLMREVYSPKIKFCAASMKRSHNARHVRLFKLPEKKISKLTNLEVTCVADRSPGKREHRR